MRERAIVAVLASCAGAIGFVACGEGKEARTTPGPASAQREANEQALESTVAREETAPPSDIARALASSRVHLDLLALAHMADVSHHGPYIDFGTPARLHSTMGRWHNGFLSDVKAGERDFTRMGEEARAYVQIDDAGPLTLRLRGRAIGSRSIVVYVNGERAGQVNFAGDGVEQHDLRIDAARLVRGENTVLLRASGTREIGGERVAAEIDSLWFLSGAPPEGELHPPRFAELVRDLSIGGQARRSVVVRGPTTVT
jgi:hypothetical protein